MDPKEYLRTLRSLHGVAELLLAGPQYRASGTIRLAAAPGGFATTAAPRLAVAGDVLSADGAEVGALSGSTYAALAATAGVSAEPPRGVYADGSGVAPQDTIEVDPACARVIAAAFETGDRALRAFAPEATPVLWPEHFDLALTVAEVNYGVSPGDGAIGEPYAYVGPWSRREGPFWNVSFGAARTLTELSDAEGVREFFAEGAREAGGERSE
ncbi:hypothetical protein K7711_04075 [Nocardia sp. CA2R105]|uniref:hypothetical protein n=1 Tax=Nocardia coffeae TaxID=2873381 RepID=UPI001CA69DC7|nr:hypothetical protein [Nocardia coffeae]MBY8855645.1 hypothetical protein [Nocardia coffeae]